VAGFTRKYEHWQLDELPLTLLWLSVGLSWFAFRRVREVRFALAQRIEAQVQVAALLAHNRELAQRLIVVQEHERRVLARDLHDEIGQNCTAIRAEARFILHAGVHAQAMGDADTCAMRCEPIMGSAQRIAQVAQRLHAMVHNMLLRLRPPALDSLGLEAALQMLCESWETQTGISCGFFPENVPTLLADATAVAVFRVVQESLTNVARHAGATQVTVKLRPSADGACLHLRIQDDGCGLAPQAAANTSPAALGHLGMYERVAALHGRIDFMSGPGQGLCIAVAVPLLIEVLPP
jgi:two-component system sensor histidine kinase UhpB